MLKILTEVYVDYNFDIWAISQSARTLTVI